MALVIWFGYNPVIVFVVRFMVCWKKIEVVMGFVFVGESPTFGPKQHDHAG